MGIYAGAGIHGTDDVGSLGTRRLARLHADGGPGRDRALRPGRRRHPDLHRLRSPGQRQAREPAGGEPATCRMTAMPAAVAERARGEPGLGAALERLRPRAAHPRRRRRRPCGPTAATCSSSRAWATARGLEPGDARLSRPARLRRGALRAAAGASRASPASSPPTRSLFDHLVATGGSRRRTRPTCCRRPKRDSRLPRVLGRDEVAALLDRIPAADAARGPRPGAVRARLLVRPALPRRSSSWTSATSTSTSETRARHRQGRARRGWCRSASPLSGRSSRYLETAAPRARAGRATSRRCSSPAAAAGSRRPTSAAGCESWVREAARRRADLAAHPAPLVRHPPARGRRRPALDPGAARPRERLDDPDLHPGRALAAARASTQSAHPRA